MGENMPAISLHQPWASLCVTRQPDLSAYDHWRETGDLDAAAALDGRIVKRFETRSWPCPPKLRGSRILIHATKQSRIGLRIGDYTTDITPSSGYYMRRFGDTANDRIPLPLGAIVGSATIEACGPITTQEAVENDTAPLDWLVKVYDEGAAMRIPQGIQSVRDQLPYGDWTPGRYAWLLTDAAPTTERCPHCGGRGVFDAIGDAYNCDVCGGAGRCDPIPARGRQRIWNWEYG